MKNLTNVLLVILIAISATLLTLYLIDRNKSTPTDNVSITPAEPSPFDEVVKDPYYKVSEEAKGPTTSIAFDRTTHDFGKIKENIISKTTFKFTNTGSEDLFISNAVGSCGCTVPEWSKEPIKPGNSGEIKIEFDSKDKSGEQLKTVTVSSNTQPATTVLNIKSTILPKP